MILKKKLDKLLKEDVLTQEEYASFFQHMSENENGYMIGCVPAGNAYHKYCLDGDLLNGNLLEFLKKRVTPPIGADDMDETFGKYGIMIYGVCEYWHWFTKDNITEYALNNGRRPIEDASELELWKMIAIASRYWETFYSDCYHQKES